jgi:hypothetical protein
MFNALDHLQAFCFSKHLPSLAGLSLFEMLCLFADEILHFVRGLPPNALQKNLVGFFLLSRVSSSSCEDINHQPESIYVEILLAQIFINCLKFKTLNLCYLILKVVFFCHAVCVAYGSKP